MYYTCIILFDAFSLELASGIILTSVKKAEKQCYHFAVTHATMPTVQSISPQTKACHIHKLPIELLAAIFDEHSVHDWQAPFIDFSVCRRWRETTLLYPKLWSHITIPRHCNKKPSSNIKASLSRSRETPLFITFKHPQITYKERYLIDHMLFSKEVASRIRVFCYEGYLKALPTNCIWRTLRALHLKAWCSGTAVLPFDRQHFPSLEELILNGISRLPTLGVVPTLRYLLLSGVQDPSWLLLLLLCSDTLVELIVHNCLPPHFSSTIHLPNLRYLGVFDSFSFNSDLSSFRSHLAAPNLSIIHEQPNYRASFNLRLNFPSVVEYACRLDLLPLDENVFEETLGLQRMALMCPLDGLENIFRLMATSAHHLSHLSAIELFTPDGILITDSQWLELLELLTGTPLSTTLRLKPMPRVSSVLRPFFGIFLPSFPPHIF
jgi:hypothetical protein